jgi:hypothetical protein
LTARSRKLRSISAAEGGSCLRRVARSAGVTTRGGPGSRGCHPSLSIVVSKRRLMRVLVRATVCLGSGACAPSRGGRIRRDQALSWGECQERL